MHNREVTHIVNADSLSKTQLIVKNKYSFCFQLRETYIKTENDSNSLFTSLCIEYTVGSMRSM